MKRVIFFLLISSYSFAQVKTIEQRVDSVYALMTLDEKIGQLNQLSSGIGKGPVVKDDKYEKQIKLVRDGKIGSFLNLVGAENTKEFQRVAVEESRSKIPLIFGFDVIHGLKTIFPVPLAESCSWDPEAVEKSARYSAKEASAIGLHWTFAPMVDIARDPRWGRIVEGAGEDPYLGSKMAAARVKGFQGNLSEENIIACAKHFAAYGGAEGGRDYSTVDISERTLREVYLPPFKAAVDAGVKTFMCSFNEISGVPSSANKHLLTDILRNEWKFRGMVVSDWNSIGELISHGVAEDSKDAAILALNAGVDMDMESRAYVSNLAELMNSKRISEEVFNEAVKRVLRIKFELGLFDNPYRNCNLELEKKNILSLENREAARDVARKSIVLLKNENQILPLRKDLKSIALIGPLANNQKELLGSWTGFGNPDDVVTLLQGIKNNIPTAKINFANGCDINSSSRLGFAEAVSAAKNSDVVILALGEEGWMSGEAESRSTIDLPGVQEDLAKEIISTGKPVIVVLMNGRPLSISMLSEKAQAIVEAWFLGTEAGNAISDVLFGDYSPSGKLTVTFPRTVGQIPIYYNHKNTGRPGSDKEKWNSKYRDLPLTPLYPFGFGLSYTNFQYSNLLLSSNKIKNGESVKVKVDIKNTGDRDGEEVVQLYIQDLVGNVTRPVMELKDFSKIHLKAGEIKTVEFNLTADKLKFLNIDMKEVIEPGDFKVYVGTNSVDVLTAEFTVLK